jgi:hypothetical protein
MSSTLDSREINVAPITFSPKARNQMGLAVPGSVSRIMAKVWFRLGI